jgi:hypothetical protein
MKKILLLVAFGICSWNIWAQDSTESAATEAPQKKFVRATFNSTKIINMQSVEIVSKGNLQFMISHHFDYVWDKDRGGASKHNFRQNLAHLFGLNSSFARTYLAFDYSPLTWANVGVASTGNANFEGWLKFRILRQQTGKKAMPISLGWFSLANIYTGLKGIDEFTDNRWAFMHQLLIARKFSDRFSLQLMPTVIHFNIVPYGINNSNLVWSMGVGGKYKAAPKMNLTMEYSRQFNMYENLISKTGSIVNYSPNLLSAGIEINTGGHLFQFYIGNTIEATNINQLARNETWLFRNSTLNKEGKFALGFTINRSLSLKK